MAIDYRCGADTPMSVLECKKLLMYELGLRVSTQHPDLWLVGEGVTVVVQDVNQVFSRGELHREAYGFTPRIVIAMRPVFGSHSEQGMQTIMRTVDLMLHATDGDFGFSYECERVLLLRRNGKVFVRENYLDHINKEDIARITVPYQFKALKP